MGTSVKDAMSNKDLMEQFIKENTWIVRTSLKRIKFPPRYYEDMYQVGMMELYRSITAFDDTREVLFSTYAFQGVYGAVRNALIRGGYNQIKPPRYYEKVIRMYREGESPETICEVTGKPMDRVLAVINTLDVSSLDFNIDTHGDFTSLGDVIPSCENIAEEVIDKLNIIDFLSKHFTKEERFILMCTVMLGDNQTIIANKLGVSQMNVSRKLKSIRQRIAEKLEEVV